MPEKKIIHAKKEDRSQSIYVADPSTAITIGEIATEMAGQIPNVLSPNQIKYLLRVPKYAKTLKVDLSTELNKTLTVLLANRFRQPLAVAGQMLTIGEALEDRQKGLQRPMSASDYLLGGLDGGARIIVDSAIGESLHLVLSSVVGLHPLISIPLVAVCSSKIRQEIWEMQVPQKMVEFYGQYEQTDREIANAFWSSFKTTTGSLTETSASFSDKKSTIETRPFRSTPGLLAKIESNSTIPDENKAPKPIVSPPENILPTMDVVKVTSLGRVEKSIEPVSMSSIPSMHDPKTSRHSAHPPDLKPVIDTQALFSSMPKMQAAVERRAFDAWEVARAENTSLLTGLKEAGFSFSIHVGTSQPSRLDANERDYLSLHLPVGHFTDAANRAEYRLDKQGKLSDMSLLGKKAQQAINAIQTTPLILSDVERQTEIQKVINKYEQLSRRTAELMVPMQAATYEHLGQLYSEGRYQDYLHEFSTKKDHFGGGFRRELELKKAYAEAALAKTPNEKRQAAMSLQHVKEAQYPSIKTGIADWTKTLDQVVGACKVMKREHFSSWFSWVWGPNPQLIKTTQDNLHTDMVKLGKAALDLMYSGLADELGKDLGHDVQSNRAIKELAEASQFDVAHSVLPAYLQQGQKTREINQLNLEKLSGAIPEIVAQLQAEADDEDRLLKEKNEEVHIIVKEIPTPSEQPIKKPGALQKEYIPFCAEVLRVSLGFLSDAHVISDTHHDVGAAWTTLAEKYVLANPSKTWLENYVFSLPKPIMDKSGFLNTGSSVIGALLGAGSFITTLDSAFGRRIIDPHQRRVLDSLMQKASLIHEGLQFSMTAVNLAASIRARDLFSSASFLDAYHLTAFPVTCWQLYREKQKNTHPYFSERRRDYVLDDAFSLWNSVKGLVSLSANHPKEAAEMTAAISAKIGVVAAAPVVLVPAVGLSGIFYHQKRLCPKVKEARMNNVYLALSRGALGDATEWFHKVQDNYPKDTVIPQLRRDIRLMELIGPMPFGADNDKETTAKILKTSLGFVSKMNQSYMENLSRHGLFAMANRGSEKVEPQSSIGLTYSPACASAT